MSKEIWQPKPKPPPPSVFLRSSTDRDTKSLPHKGSVQETGLVRQRSSRSLLSSPSPRTSTQRLSTRHLPIQKKSTTDLVLKKNSESSKEDEEKKKGILADELKALYCLISLEDYRKENKLKSAGLLFKDIPSFQPLEPDSVIDNEVKDIAGLAQRLRELHLTIEQDKAGLERLALVFDDPTRQELDAALSYINEREIVLSILDSLQQEIDQELRQRLEGRRSLRMEAKAFEMLLESEMGRLGLPMIPIEYTSLLDRVTARDFSLEDFKSSDKVARFVYEAVLLAHNQRNGWAELAPYELSNTAKAVVEQRERFQKLNQNFEQYILAKRKDSGGELVPLPPLYDLLRYPPDKIFPKLRQKAIDSGQASPLEDTSSGDLDNMKTFGAEDAPKRLETKETKKSFVKERRTSGQNRSIPPELESLQQSLGRWLHLGKGLSAVTERLAVIRNYCIVVNRITECTAHLKHDTLLARQILAKFKRETLKDHPALVTAVCQLAAAQDPKITTTLLGILIDSLKETSLLDFSLLEGIAVVLHHAPPEQVSLGNLNALLKLLVERSGELGSYFTTAQTEEALPLLQALGAVLSSMALISQWCVIQESKSDKPKTVSNESKEKAPESRLRRFKRWFEEKLPFEELSEGKPGQPAFSLDDYEKLCKVIQLVRKAVRKRFDLDSPTASERQPELIFALSLISQALMRVAHQEPTKVAKFLEGAKLFFTVVENVKNAVTDISVDSLLEAGKALSEFIQITPVADKFREWTGETEERRDWFEHYLILKRLVDNNQLIKLEEMLIEMGQLKEGADFLKGKPAVWNYSLTQGLLQLLERVARWDLSENVRQASEQCVLFLLDSPWWRWPKQADFKAVQSLYKKRLEDTFPAGTSTLRQRMAQQLDKDSQAESRRLLNKARSECQKDHLSYQIHDYCVRQVREARKDTDWKRDDKRYVPALGKPRSGLEEKECSSGLFSPIFKEWSTLDIRESSAEWIKTKKTVLLIRGDAGTGKSLFMRRHHLKICRHYLAVYLKNRRVNTNCRCMCILTKVQTNCR